MKSLPLLAVCCFGFSLVRAQKPVPGITEIKPGVFFDFKDGKYFIKPVNDSSIVLQNLLLLQNKKPGVYSLPQDNMPCIVPNTKDLALMPNAFKGEVKVPYVGRAPRIPNAVVPKVFPDTKR